MYVEDDIMCAMNRMNVDVICLTYLCCVHKIDRKYKLPLSVIDAYVVFLG